MNLLIATLISALVGIALVAYKNKQLEKRQIWNW